MQTYPNKQKKVILENQLSTQFKEKKILLQYKTHL